MLQLMQEMKMAASFFETQRSNRSIDGSDVRALTNRFSKIRPGEKGTNSARDPYADMEEDYSQTPFVNRSPAWKKQKFNPSNMTSQSQIPDIPELSTKGASINSFNRKKQQEKMQLDLIINKLSHLESQQPSSKKKSVTHRRTKSLLDQAQKLNPL